MEEAWAALEDGDPERALELSERALAAGGEDLDAHRCRAAALADLRRFDDAEDAYRAALEISPDEPLLHLELAELLATSRSADEGALEDALELARRGQDLAGDDAELAADLSIVKAMAHNGLGDPEAALQALADARGEVGRRADVLIEEGAALFELCRFPEARKALEDAVKKAPDDPWANHLLGLVLERAGDEKAARKRFDQARRLAPEDFPEPVRLTPEEFDRAVKEAVERLPGEIRRHLGEVLISVQALPADVDLMEGRERAHSPSILGIFRGASLRERAASGELPPAIFLYQKNLERIASTREELIEQIERTVIHEVGHLIGFSEEDLHDRGLE